MRKALGFENYCDVETSPFGAGKGSGSTEAGARDEGN
jgi:hypothetical protein